MPLTALLILLLGLSVGFGLRGYLAWRRTGDAGFRRPEAAPFSLEWWGPVLFVLSLLLVLAAPLTALVGWLTPPAALDLAALHGAGIAVMVLGLVFVLVSQTAMGSSWRVGVDPSEHTGLVTDGVFALVRNPVFTAMGVLIVGMLAAVPTVLSAAALAAFIAGVQIQVRAMEEPYLLRMHPQDYPAYAARTGRFLPGLGRLSAQD